MTADPDYCPIVATIKMLGNQWNIITIRYLHDGPLKYNQLRRTMGNISSKTLSRSLKHLTAQEIVERRVLHESPISVEYSLTQRGKELSETIYEIRQWGKKWLKPKMVQPKSAR
jgi:DNA-binding HxlR family transcriptional regulator